MKLVKASAAEPEADANDPLAVEWPPPPGMAKPSRPPTLVTTCEPELVTVVVVKVAEWPKSEPLHDTIKMPGAPVLDNVAQFNGLDENDSRSRPEMILTLVLEVWQLDRFPLRRAAARHPL